MHRDERTRAVVRLGAVLLGMALLATQLAGCKESCGAQSP